MKPFETRIEHITCESGDWEILKVQDKVLESAHSVDFLEVLKFLGYDVVETCVTDELMQEIS